MPTEYITPGVYVEEQERQRIVGAATSVVALIGWTPEGELCKPSIVRSTVEFQEKCGGLDARCPFSHSVQHFFENGGTTAVILRLADPAAPDVPVLAGTAAFADLLTRTTGLAALDGAEFELLCAPGETRADVLAQLQAYCARRRAFLIADAASEATLDTLAGGAPVELTGSDAANAALYWPWVIAPDPLAGGGPKPFPPSGFVAGVYARIDATRGLWKAPAGLEATVAGSVGLTQRLSDADQERLNPVAINALREFPAGRVVWGARTLAGQDVTNSEWKYVPVRRLALFIERSIEEGLSWVVFEPNVEATWARVRASVTAFMNTLFRAGAFQGPTPRDAYFVRCDASVITAADVDMGRLNCVIGFAPVKRGEFIVLSFGFRVDPAADMPLEALNLPTGAGGRSDPYENFRFRVRIGTRGVAGFSATAVVPGDGTSIARHFANGITCDAEFGRWLHGEGPVQALDLVLEVLDERGAVAATEQLRGARARAAAVLPAPDADQNAIAIQSLRVECTAIESAPVGRVERARANWQDLVASESTVRALREVATALRARGQPQSTVVFAGETGTGKTLAAEIVAADAGLDLYRIDLAAVVSKYIGETEKNLDRALDSAERAGAVLLIDEADALFGERTEVADAHVRYANVDAAAAWLGSPRWPPVFVETRSLPTSSHEAVRTWKVVQLPMPEAPQREELWRRHWPEWIRQLPRDREELVRIGASGRQIKEAVRVSAAVGGQPSIDLLRRVVTGKLP